MKNRKEINLGRDLQVTCDDYMSKLLDLYNCRDWGMGFVEFFEKATEVTLETIGRLQSEHMNEEECLCKDCAV